MTLSATERLKKAIEVLTHHRAERDLELTRGGTTVIVRIWAGSKFTGFNANVLRRLLELEPFSIELHDDATLHIWFWPEGHQTSETTTIHESQDGRVEIVERDADGNEFRTYGTTEKERDL